MTSNRGLCGSFNSNIIRTGESFLRENKGTSYENISVSTIGRKGTDHFRRRGTRAVQRAGTKCGTTSSSPEPREISVNMSNRYARGELDAVYLCYNEFKSAISQKAVIHQLLPVKPLDGWEEQAPGSHRRAGFGLRQPRGRSGPHQRARKSSSPRPSGPLRPCSTRAPRATNTSTSPAARPCPGHVVASARGHPDLASPSRVDGRRARRPNERHGRRLA